VVSKLAEAVTKNSKGNEKPQHMLWRLPSLSALPERFAGNVSLKPIVLRVAPSVDAVDRCPGTSLQ
jgi:hypothetical protein